MPKVLDGSWEPIFQLFLFKAQNNEALFNYYNLSDEEAMELTLRRAKGFLLEGISRLYTQCLPDVDFHDYDIEEEKFNFEITSDEVDMFASLMIEKMIEKDRGKLMVYANMYSSQNIKALFSGWGERNSFINFFKGVQDENTVIIDNYASRDRLTGERKPISDYNL